MFEKHYMFWSSLWHRFQRDKPGVVLLWAGVIVCVFCTSVMLSIAVRQYRIALGSNRYATLTFDPGDAPFEESSELIEYAKTLSEDGICNILFFTRWSSNCVLIGWEGIDGNKWFPITSGRFFSEYEQKDGAKVVFLSDSFYQNMFGSQEIVIDGNNYRIIGTGWIKPYNFQIAVSPQSQNQLHVTLDELIEMKYVIIPFRCFASMAVPEQVLIHFNSATYEDLKEYAHNLCMKFPGSEVNLPKQDSSVVFTESHLKYILLSLVLCLIAGITIIQLLSEWISGYKRELQVYHLCGMNQKRCAVFVCGHWLIYYISGAFVGMAFHVVVSPILKKLFSNDYPPNTIVLVAYLSALFFLSLLYVKSLLKKSMNLDNGGDQW